MDSKTRSLIIGLEVLLLVTAAIVTVIDFKLKQDIVAMLTEAKETIAYGRQRVHETGDLGTNPSRVYRGDMVRDAAGMETASAANANGSHSKAGPGKAPRNAPKRNPGNGNPPVPEPDKPVGP